MKGGNTMDNESTRNEFPQDEVMEIEAIDLGTLECLEEDIVPCTCCGNSCSC